MAGKYTSTTRTVADGEVTVPSLDAGGNIKTATGALVVTAAPSASAANGTHTPLTVDAYSALRVMPAEVLAGADGNSNTFLAGIRMSGNWGILQTAGYTFNGASWDRTRKPSAVARLLSAAASTNSTNVKASAGDVFRISGYNNNAAARFLKLYNKATAPTVGTDTPVATYRLPPTAQFDIELHSLYFSLGIGYGITTAAADADTGALTAGDIVAMNLIYA